MSLKLNLFTQIQSVNLPKVPAFKAGNTGTFNYETEFNNDKFSTNPIYDKLGNKSELETLAKSNPKIMGLLKEYNLPLKLNMDVLEEMV